MTAGRLIQGVAAGATDACYADPKRCSIFRTVTPEACN